MPKYVHTNDYELIDRMFSIQDNCIITGMPRVGIDPKMEIPTHLRVMIRFLRVKVKRS